MVAYVHIEYSTYQFSEESKGGGGGIHPSPGPCVTEKSVVLRGLKRMQNSRSYQLIYIYNYYGMKVPISESGITGRTGHKQWPRKQNGRKEVERGTRKKKWAKEREKNIWPKNSAIYSKKSLILKDNFLTWIVLFVHWWFYRHIINWGGESTLKKIILKIL